MLLISLRPSDGHAFLVAMRQRTVLWSSGGVRYVRSNDPLPTHVQAAPSNERGGGGLDGVRPAKYARTMCVSGGNPRLPCPTGCCLMNEDGSPSAPVEKMRGLEGTRFACPRTYALTSSFTANGALLSGWFMRSVSILPLAGHPNEHGVAAVGFAAELW